MKETVYGKTAEKVGLSEDSATLSPSASATLSPSVSATLSASATLFPTSLSSSGGRGDGPAKGASAI